jgi:hypothetical protein
MQATLTPTVRPALASDAQPSNRTARSAGVLYLIIIVAGIFAQFFVRMSLIDPTDAAATAAAVLGAESLFRMGIAADLVMIAADVAIAIAFFLLLAPVSRGLSLLAAFFRLTQATILGFNLMNLFVGLQLLTGGTGPLGAVEEAERHALALMFFEAHGTGYAVGLAFFALSLGLVGYLIYRSGYLPKFLAVLLIIAAGGYIADTLARTLLTDYAAVQPIFDMVVFGPAVIAEVATALWLLIRGVRAPAAPRSAGA